MKHLSYNWVIITILIFTFFSCNKKCYSDLPSCKLEPDSGPCQAAMTKYYFHKDEKNVKSLCMGVVKGLYLFKPWKNV